MVLDYQAAAIETSRDTRRGIRRKLHLEASASSPGSPAARTAIYNLSERGMLIETTADLRIGELIEVDLPHVWVSTAEVMWSSDHLFGCRFSRDLTPAAVSAALLRAPFDRSASNDDKTTNARNDAEPSEEKLPLAVRLAVNIGLGFLAWAIAIAIGAWALS